MFVPLISSKIHVYVCLGLTLFGINTYSDQFKYEDNTRLRVCETVLHCIVFMFYWHNRQRIRTCGFRECENDIITIVSTYFLLFPFISLSSGKYHSVLSELRRQEHTNKGYGLDKILQRCTYSKLAPLIKFTQYAFDTN